MCRIIGYNCTRRSWSASFKFHWNTKTSFCSTGTNCSRAFLEIISISSITVIPMEFFNVHMMMHNYKQRTNYNYGKKAENWNLKNMFVFRILINLIYLII